MSINTVILNFLLFSSLFLSSCSSSPEKDQITKKKEFKASLYDCSGNFEMPEERIIVPCFLNNSCPGLLIVGHRKGVEKNSVFM